jgi:hypothetical protein
LFELPGFAVKQFLLEVAKGRVPRHTIFEKYGKNPKIDSATVPQDIWNGGGDYTGFPVSDFETMEVFSSDDRDKPSDIGAHTLKVMRLLDDEFKARPDVTVELNGTTPVSLGPLKYFRGGSRMRIVTAGSAGENLGEITLRHTTTTTNIFAVMPVNNNRTAIMAGTVPFGKTLYITTVKMQMARLNGVSGSATMTLRTRFPGEVFDSLINPEITHASPYFSDNACYRLPEFTDFKMRCQTVSNNDTIITGDLIGFFVDN